MELCSKYSLKTNTWEYRHMVNTISGSGSLTISMSSSSCVTNAVTSSAHSHITATEMMINSRPALIDVRERRISELEQRVAMLEAQIDGRR